MLTGLDVEERFFLRTYNSLKLRWQPAPDVEGGPRLPQTCRHLVQIEL